MVLLLVFVSASGFRDALPNLREGDTWVRAVGVLQVASGSVCLAWLTGLWRRAGWTIPVLVTWAGLFVALGTTATFAWDTFTWPAVLGAFISLVILCALVLWWARVVLKRRVATAA